MLLPLMGISLKDKTFNTNPSITDDFKVAIQQKSKKYYQSPQKL